MTGKNSLNTAALYLRGIRIAFGVALDKKLITEAQNPFGKRKFQIRTAESKKIAMSVDELIDFMAYKPKNEREQIAHDFTVFSYLANGMNFIDIANLTEATLKKEHFTFFRQKTMDTALVRKEVIVDLTNKKIKEILDRRHKPGSFYIFGILNDTDNEEQRHDNVHNFRQRTNRAIKSIAKKLGICDETFSTYTMRHTFTQIMLEQGVDIAIVAQCLGHMSVVTTQKYAKKLDVKTAQSFYKILVPTKGSKKVVEHDQAA
jgi:integrase